MNLSHRKSDTVTTRNGWSVVNYGAYDPTGTHEALFRTPPVSCEVAALPDTENRIERLRISAASETHAWVGEMHVLERNFELDMQAIETPRKLPTHSVVRAFGTGDDFIWQMQGSRSKPGASSEGASETWTAHGIFSSYGFSSMSMTARDLCRFLGKGEVAVPDTLITRFGGWQCIGLVPAAVSDDYDHNGVMPDRLYDYDPFPFASNLFVRGDRSATSLWDSLLTIPEQTERPGWDYENVVTAELEPSLWGLGVGDFVRPSNVFAYWLERTEGAKLTVTTGSDSDDLVGRAAVSRLDADGTETTLDFLVEAGDASDTVKPPEDALSGTIERRQSFYVGTAKVLDPASLTEFTSWSRAQYLTPDTSHPPEHITVIARRVDDDGPKPLTRWGLWQRCDHVELAPGSLIAMTDDVDHPWRTHGGKHGSLWSTCVEHGGLDGIRVFVKMDHIYEFDAYGFDGPRPDNDPWIRAIRAQGR